MMKSLAVYTIISTTLTGALAIAAFVHRPKFEEIDVERINIVERDGRMRMTLSNAERSPGWIHHGKLIPGRAKSAGMIFYNDEGEEDGGLLFGGKKVGDSVASWGHLSFDQYDQDQDISIDLSEEKASAGKPSGSSIGRTTGCGTKSRKRPSWIRRCRPARRATRPKPPCSAVSLSGCMLVETKTKSPW